MKTIANTATACPDWCTNHHGQDDLIHTRQLTEQGGLAIEAVQTVDLADDGRHTIIADPVIEVVLGGNELLHDLTEEQCRAIASLSDAQWRFLIGQLTTAADWLHHHT